MRMQMQMLKMKVLLVLQTMILHVIWCSGQEWMLMLKTKRLEMVNSSSSWQHGGVQGP